MCTQLTTMLKQAKKSKQKFGYKVVMKDRKGIPYSYFSRFNWRKGLNRAKGCVDKNSDYISFGFFHCFPTRAEARRFLKIRNTRLSKIIQLELGKEQYLGQHVNFNEQFNYCTSVIAKTAKWNGKFIW